MRDSSQLWRIVIAAIVLSTIAGAESLEERVQRLAEQNERQQQELNELRAKLAVNQGESATDVATESLHRDILDLSVVDARVAHALAEQGASEIPGWLDGLTFSADMRVRYEGAWYEDDDAYPEDRNRGRFRLRFGFKKKWSSDEAWSAGFRLATGSEDPTSTNQTFTNYFSKKPVWVDQAYIHWAPKDGVLKGLELIGGKMKQPFLTTWALWDTDVNPEGAFEKYTLDLFDGDLQVYGNFGQFFLEEHSKRPADMSLLVYGGGFDAKVIKDGDFTLSGGFATNFYDYTFVHDNTPAPWGNNPSVTVNGRTYAGAEDFDQLDFVAYLKGQAWGIDYHAYANVAVNTGVDRNAPQNDPEYDDAWNFGLKLGKNKSQGDISLEGAVYKVEANSIFAFSDSDIEQADHTGGVIRGFYNVTDFAVIGGSAYFVDKISEKDESIDHFDKLQLDLSIKF